MTSKTIFKLVAYTSLVANLSCERNQKDMIPGRYASKFSLTVIDEHSNDTIGSAEVRDTIIVELVTNNYRLSNQRYRCNDYDSLGWRNMKHSNARPFSSFEAIWDNDSNQLTPLQPCPSCPTLRFSDDDLVTSSGLRYHRVRSASSTAGGFSPAAARCTNASAFVFSIGLGTRPSFQVCYQL